MKILVLAGGFDQIALIQSIKELGHEVILADYFENPPAKCYADMHYQVSTLDIDAVTELAHKEKVDLITTACTDQALLTVAKASETLNLPCYISYSTALNVTNKRFMKQKFKESGIPTADCIILNNPEDIEIKCSDISYPAVVKPCDCNSSKGVCKVLNDAEMKEAVCIGFKLSRNGLVLVEDFSVGEEISIDAWVDGEGAKILGVSATGKIPDNDGAFTIYKSCYPCELSPELQRKIKEIAENIAKGFELENTPLLIQAIYNKDNIHVIEFSARMGGGTKYRLIEHISGINIMDAYVKRVINGSTPVLNPVISKDLIELLYIYTDNGKICQINGVETLIKKNIISEYYQYKPIGSSVGDCRTSSDRVAGILIKAQTIQELDEKKDEVRNTIEIRNEFGENIVKKEILL